VWGKAGLWEVVHGDEDVEFVGGQLLEVVEVDAFRVGAEGSGVVCGRDR